MAASESGEPLLPVLERPLSAKERGFFRRLFIAGLLIVGLLLTTYSVPLAAGLESIRWTPGAVVTDPVSLRWLGALLFVAGLVERVLTVVVRAKDD